MPDITKKLSQLAPLFSDILKIGSGLGLSVGVLHHGEVVYKSHFGRREVASLDPPNGDTMYYITSLTKAITAAAVAILFDQGRVKCDTPVAEYLPEFRTRDDEIGQQATLVDLLSHRTGLTGANALWNHSLSETAIPFRQGFSYKNWGYGLGTALIKHTTGAIYGKFVQENIFEPLNLQRIAIYRQDCLNVSSANMVRNDGLSGAGGGKASLSGLLHLYKSLLSTYEAEQNPASSESGLASSPFRQVSNLFDGKVKIGNGDITKNAYALGWVKSVLPPATLYDRCEFYVSGGENIPIIGSELPGTTVLHHHGNLIGAISSVEELILQTLIGEEPLDYRVCTQKAKAAHLKQFSDLVDELEQGKTERPLLQSLQAYAGRYYNGIGNFVLGIPVRDDRAGLKMKFQDLDDVVYDIVVYDGDTFYLPCNREVELGKEMMSPWPWSGVHKICFDVASDGSVHSLSWGHDRVLKPRYFREKAKISPGLTRPLKRAPTVRRTLRDST